MCWRGCNVRRHRRSLRCGQRHTRLSYLTTRILMNLTATTPSTPLLDRFRTPVDPGGMEKRWLDGFYLDTPEEWDDPYRFFGW